MAVANRTRTPPDAARQTPHASRVTTFKHYARIHISTKYIRNGDRKTVSVGLYSKMVTGTGSSQQTATNTIMVNTMQNSGVLEKKSAENRRVSFDYFFLKVICYVTRGRKYFVERIFEE